MFADLNFSHTARNSVQVVGTEETPTLSKRSML